MPCSADTGLACPRLVTSTRIGRCRAQGFDSQLKTQRAFAGPHLTYRIEAHRVGQHGPVDRAAQSRQFDFLAEGGRDGDVEQRLLALVGEHNLIRGFAVDLDGIGRVGDSYAQRIGSGRASGSPRRSGRPCGRRYGGFLADNFQTRFVSNRVDAVGRDGDTIQARGVSRRHLNSISRRRLLPGSSEAIFQPSTSPFSQVEPSVAWRGSRLVSKLSPISTLDSGGSRCCWSHRREIAPCRQSAAGAARFA